MIRIGLTDTGTEWKHLNYVRWIGGAVRVAGPGRGQRRSRWSGFRRHLGI